MDASIQTAMMMAQQAPRAAAPKPTGKRGQGRQGGQGIRKRLHLPVPGLMFSGIQTDGLTGGGQGEEMFRSMMINEYGKAIEAARRLRPGQRR